MSTLRLRQIWKSHADDIYFDRKSVEIWNQQTEDLLDKQSYPVIAADL